MFQKSCIFAPLKHKKHINPLFAITQYFNQLIRNTSCFLKPDIAALVAHVHDK
jgi:hypothetical protein